MRSRTYKPARLDIERLRDLLSFDQDTGVFRWRFDMKGPAKAGRVAGSLCPTTGYLTIKVDGVRYMAHRLAWTYAFGVTPTNQIDHINGIRTDNRLSNLRDVPQAINSQNLRAAKHRNSSGMLGVSKKRGRWRARIGVGGVQIALGTFDTPELAHDCYLEAKRRLHAGCTI
jgi:hypothetical protein